MNLLFILIAHAIVALSGAVALIIFLYFNGPQAPQPASIEIDLSPTGEWFLKQKADIERRLHLFTEGELLNKIGDRSLAFSPDGDTMAIGTENDDIRLDNVTPMRRILLGHTRRILSGHTDLVISLAFSPDGSCLISGSMDKTIRLWDTKSGECLTTIFLLIPHTTNKPPPFTVEITMCTGNYYGDVVFVTVEGTVSAHTKLNQIHLTTFANQRTVGTVQLGDFISGEQKPFRVTGTLPEIGGKPLSCHVELRSQN